MSPYLFAIGTAVPEHSQKQENFARNQAQGLNLDPAAAERLAKICRNTRIEKRHTFIPDFLDCKLRGDFFGPEISEKGPGTFKRNELYKQYAPKLAHEAASRAIVDWGGRAEEITHVISVSCTGMIAPGIEFSLVDSLALSRSVTRLGINFMGCFGAFRGLAAARAFAVENPQHRILVVCTELCSLHFQTDNTTMTFVANSLFADGAAALVVGGSPRGSERPIWSIEKHRSLALENTFDEMTWEASDNGYVMTLSEKVPSYIKHNIRDFVSSLRGERCCDWPVHPGGKAILHAIAQACELDSAHDLRHSWKTLRDYGNMSSATFLFVLEALRREGRLKPWSIGLGFGPGLTIEGVLLKAIAREGD